MKPPKRTPRKTAENHLAEWLTDPRTGEFFGRTFAVRADALHHAMTGEGRVEDLARRHRISRAAAFRHVKRARDIFGLSRV